MFTFPATHFSSAWWESNWLLNNLVSYYKADDSWSFPDAHWSNDGTISGATYTASWFINWAYDFDGTNDYISHPAPTLTTAATFSFWIKPWTLPTGLRSILSNGPANRYRISNRNNKLDVLIGNAGISDTTPWADAQTVAITDNTWQHFVVTYENWTGIEIFKNGLSSQTSTKWADINSSWSTSLIACEPDSWDTGSLGNFIEAEIDEIWFWDRVLTSDEISDLYNSWAWLPYADFTS